MPEIVVGSGDCAGRRIKGLRHCADVAGRIGRPGGERLSAGIENVLGLFCQNTIGLAHGPSQLSR